VSSKVLTESTPLLEAKDSSQKVEDKAVEEKPGKKSCKEYSKLKRRQNLNLVTVEPVQTSKESGAKSKVAKIEASKLRRRKGISGPGQDYPNDIKSVPKNRIPTRQQSQQQSR